MYYGQNTYSYPYYVNSNIPLYHTDYMSRNYQESYQELHEAILNGLKREASTIDLYRRLSKQAPNEIDKNDILHALEDKNVHLNQLTNLYITLTGRQPAYKIDKVNFESYREGLQLAQEAGEEGYDQYRKSSLLTQHPLIQHVFLHASTAEKEKATRFAFLSEKVKDYGSKPFVVNIEDVTKQNNTFRTALWTGKHLQVTLMSINVGGDIGLEVHPDLDQFIRIEQGQGLVQMGDSKQNLDFQQEAYEDFAIMVPAGKWHNLTNTGNQPLKVYSIYAPPQHPFGTIHETKAIALAAEENHDH
jgi:mannose-6-phosphate isomerase-like protein (cupin superfamily)